jgi:hypothetical protein
VLSANALARDVEHVNMQMRLKAIVATLVTADGQFSKLDWAVIFMICLQVKTNVFGLQIRGWFGKWDTTGNI